MTRALTPDLVSRIRTEGWTDAHWSRVLGLSDGTIRDARRGLTWKSHPTPPDLAPRDSTGCTHTIRAGLPQKAVPAKQRRPWA